MEESDEACLVVELEVVDVGELGDPPQPIDATLINKRLRDSLMNCGCKTVLSKGQFI